jgi:hypothetical protein
VDLTNLENIINGLQGFNSHDEVVKIVDDNQDVLVQLQKEQWMEGKGIDGQNIRPLYSEDPYFKTPEAARRYAEWKQRITPNDKRDFDAPNLFINGYYVHNSLGMTLSGDDFFLDPTSPKGKDILDEHPNASGLSPEQRLYFAEEKLLPKFAEILREKTTLQL